MGVGLAVACVAGASCAGGLPASGSPSAAQLDALYLARRDSARTRFTEADARFVTDMIAHHQQAVDAAELVAPRAGSRALRTLASRIARAQRDEIAWMELWLRDRGQPVPDLAERRGGHTHVPGMHTPAQLDALERASDDEIERLFLEYMIEHHRGALTLVQDLLATDGAAQDPATFKLASDIHADQTTEIARMERMLAEHPSGAPR